MKAGHIAPLPHTGRIRVKMAFRHLERKMYNSHLWYIDFDGNFEQDQ